MQQAWPLGHLLLYGLCGQWDPLCLALSLEQRPAPAHPLSPVSQVALCQRGVAAQVRGAVAGTKGLLNSGFCLQSGGTRSF